MAREPEARAAVAGPRRAHGVLTRSLQIDMTVGTSLTVCTMANC